MALKKRAIPTRWLQGIQEVVIAVRQQVAGGAHGGRVGDLKVIRPTSAAVVASPQIPAAPAGAPSRHPRHDQEQDRAGGLNHTAGRSLPVQSSGTTVRAPISPIRGTFRYLGLSGNIRLDGRQ
jgi:hypothetical protein